MDVVEFIIFLEIDNGASQTYELNEEKQGSFNNSEAVNL
jgi:hypothetical protein